MPVHACESRCAREGTSSKADPAQGRLEPSSEADLIRGRREPSSEADLTRGGALLGRFGGPRGPPRCGSCCVYFALGPKLVLCFSFFAGFKQDSPRFFRGPSWLSPTVAPEHLRVFRSGSRRCWSLLIGHSSLPVANAFPWGRVSGPAGLAPEALQERERSCRGFLAEIYQRVWYMSLPASAMFQPASVMHTRLVHFAFGAPQEVSRASSPRAWAHSRRSGRALRLVLNAPSPSLRGTEGEVSATPIDRVADCEFLVELLAGGSSGRPCPVR
jgi:hypothetical protein